MHPMRQSKRQIEDFAEILEILEKADACRIALADGDQPYLVALNHGVVTEPGFALFFHCANEGRKLEILRRNPRACFQVDVDHELLRADHACGYSMNYRSVVGFGTLSIVTDPAERRRGLDALMRHYGGKSDGWEYLEKNLGLTTVLKLSVEEWSGKKLQKRH